MVGSHSVIRTVLGDIDPAGAGLTLMHEHLLADTTGGGIVFQMPADPALASIALEPLSLDNLWFVRHNFKENLDNLVLSDVDTAIDELARFRDLGGGTLVDVTPSGIGRDPDALVRIATSTGVNVVMGCGFYVDGSYPEDADIDGRSIDELADEIAADVEIGVGENRVKAGIIGEIGCSWPLTPRERKVLAAAAQAQARTGAPLNIHPGRNDGALEEIRDVLAASGADLTRVIFSHIDRCGYSLEVRRSLLESGCVLEYDVFGLEGYYPASVALREGKLPEMPNDVGRIKEIRQVIDLGYLSQVVISHDIGMKMMLTKYGGWGYGHILRNVVPLMRVFGYEDEHINALLVDNPRRLLSIAQP
jgi:phosphotriesterase-related protein